MGIIFFLGTESALGARPFVTDDARLSPLGGCQLESWIRQKNNSHEFWMLPGCNPKGNFEVTMGLGYANKETYSKPTELVVQGKTLFRDLQPNNRAIGLALGRIFHSSVNSGSNLNGSSYVNLPISQSLNNDKHILHGNVGVVRNTGSNELKITWGLGSELSYSKRIQGVTELFGYSNDRPYLQVGARYSVLPNQLQFDATVGQQWNGFKDTHWISFGFRFTPQ